MRIAFVNETRRKTGGIESYLEQIIPAFLEKGNVVACLFESDTHDSVSAIQIPKGVLTWIADSMQSKCALAELQAWEPEIIFLHSPIDLELKDRLLRMAPGVFFAHNYYGTCISGMKRHASPQVRLCEKVFSPACLAYYFPRRCGGLNPITMLRRYNFENAWLTGLRDFASVVVASEHMATEYLRHGFGDRVQVVGLPVSTPTCPSAPRPFLERKNPSRLLFMGRMESYKGGLTLLDALPKVAQKLGRQIHLTFAGEGRERIRWETHAAAITQENAAVMVDFSGWLSGENLKEMLESSDLLVLPSQWPEPFGLVGLEAGAYGLPTAAFDVGGISDWLKEGVNGHLASGNPPTSQGLAEAIFMCIRDPEHYHDLSKGAQNALTKFSMEKHLSKLIPEFEKLAKISHT